MAHLIYHGEKKDRSNFYRFIGKYTPFIDVVLLAFSDMQHKESSVLYSKCIGRPTESMMLVTTLASGVKKWSRNCSSEQCMEWILDTNHHFLVFRLHTIHGNHWAIIGQSLGISARSARDKHRNITNRQRTGLWRPQEEARLTAAMKQMQSESGSEEMELHPSGTWEQVAKLVGSRNAHQCRQKWMHYMAPRILEGKWTCKDDLHLLEELEKRDEAEDEDDIDWLELSSAWNNARTPYYLRKKWSSLRRGVPNYSIRPFQGKDVLCLKKLLTCLAF